MADFKQALEVLLSWEGGYSNDRRDPGAETYCGISRKYWPNLEIWKYIDETNLLRKVEHNEFFQPLNYSVEIFYYHNFWTKEKYQELLNQDIANKIFQHHVNMGNRAIKLAQATFLLVEDGILGGQTVKALDDYDSKKFLNRYIEKLVSYYESLIEEHPQLKVFEHEWMLRAKTIGKRPN